jgi:hypothetical protein
LVAEQIGVFICPGCGEAVGPGEDYVVAYEYKLEPGFTLHGKGVDPDGAERRFHVGHFRGRMGNLHYELREQNVVQRPQ